MERYGNITCRVVNMISFRKCTVPIVNRCPSSSQTNKSGVLRKRINRAKGIVSPSRNTTSTSLRSSRGRSMKDRNLPFLLLQERNGEMEFLIYFKNVIRQRNLFTVRVKKIPLLM